LFEVVFTQLSKKENGDLNRKKYLYAEKDTREKGDKHNKAG
jgi:hypothetical protein